MEFHLLSFEGPDPYARAGGIASRITGLARALADAHDTHLWFVGDPHRAGHEVRGRLHLHRWCQWISQYHPGGVYDGERGKVEDYTRSLPPWLMPRMARGLLHGHTAIVLAEEWQTVGAVLHLDFLLRKAGLRERVLIRWNANNTYGFEHIDFAALQRAALVTTVSRYMKQRMRDQVGVDPLIVPNGLDSGAFSKVDAQQVRELRKRVRGRTLLTKVARFDPAKRWLNAVGVVAALRAQGEAPLLVARGSTEAHGDVVIDRARHLGLRVERIALPEGGAGILGAVHDRASADILFVDSHLGSEAKRLLYRGSTAVLVNSAHEPFGLVGLEAMAAGGIACTGCTGEDYAVGGANALVMQTDDPREVVRAMRRLRERPDEARAIRREAQRTAKRYTWDRVVERTLLPQLEMRFAPDASFAHELS